MRVLGCAVVAALAIGSGPALGDEVIYRWVDPGGGVHYSNVPSPGARATDLGVADEPRVGDPGEAPGGEAHAAVAHPGSDEGAGHGLAPEQASLRRQQLEREYRQTQKELRDLDAQLANLAKLRVKFARGNEATGGIGTNPDVRSPEEKAVMERREGVAQHAATLRGDYVKLRGEVTQQTGGVPDWWVDLPER